MNSLTNANGWYMIGRLIVGPALLAAVLIEDWWVTLPDDWATFYR